MMSINYPRLPGTETRKLLGFRVADVCYGIDIMNVREIVNPADLIRVPSAPARIPFP